MASFTRTEVKLNRVNYSINRTSAEVQRIKSVLIPRLLNSLKLKSLERLAHAILILKEAGITEPTKEQLAKTSGLGLTSIKTNKDEIQDLISKVTFLGTTYGESYMFGEEGSLLFNGHVLDLETSFTELSKLMVRLGFNPSIPSTLDASSIVNYLSSLVAMSLVESKVINSQISALKQLNIGENFLGFYNKVVSGSGRVHSSNKHREYFHNSDNSKLINTLFKVASNYQSGIKSMQFEPTSVCDEVMQRALDYLLLLDFEESEPQSKSTISVPRDILSQIKFRDAIILLSNTIGYKEDCFIVELNITDSITDRVYSVFTSISSDTRLALGYINYDIGAALQTITFQLLDEADRSNFPLHQELIEDKHTFRNKVIQQTGKDLAWVKTELSKLDNKNSYNSDCKILNEYFEEAILIRNLVMETIYKNNPEVFTKAELNAKDEYRKIWVEENNKFKFESTGEKKEASTFFFIWTQYEREIRNAMKSVFKNEESVLDVHDAVYSKEDISLELIEKAVLDKTGFRVKIS